MVNSESLVITLQQGWFEVIVGDCQTSLAEREHGTS